MVSSEELNGEEEEFVDEVGEEAEEEQEQEEGQQEEAADVEENEEDGVEEHLKDSVEGVFRLKRLLSRDVGDPLQKKRKLMTNSDGPRPIEQAKVKQLLQKWNLTEDVVARYVLENLTLSELKMLLDTNYTPDKFNMMKTSAEQVNNYALLLRERQGIGGGPMDVVSTFKYRWKLDPAQEQLLRSLSHKDLRFVLNEYDGDTPLEDVAAEAAVTAPQEGVAAGVAPDAPGSSTLGRFLRLELIDPLADAVVFGDANLTFAMKIAKQRKALGHVGRVIATTFETLETLKERYKEIEETIQILEEHYAEVWHGVDCTRVAVDPRFKGMEESFGAVYYNFPHAGAVSGFFDGHPLVNWRHENLMRLFFRAIRTFVKPGGSVKVSSNMGAVGVRYSYIIESATENEFLHVETVPFLEWHLHRYGRSYGDRRDVYKRPDQGQGYNVQRAESDMVYTFSYAPTGNAVAKQQIRRPPTFQTLMLCTDGPFKSLGMGEGRKRQATELFNRFMSECSGVHVG